MTIEQDAMRRISYGRMLAFVKDLDDEILDDDQRKFRDEVIRISRKPSTKTGGGRPIIMLSEREWVALNVIAINDDTSVDDIIEEAIEAYVTRMCMNGSSIGERASEALAGNYTRNDYEDEFGKLGWY